MLVTYQSNQIDEVWDKVKPLIKKVLNKIDFCYTIENIKDLLISQDMQLWTSYNKTQLESVCVTRVMMQPQYKSLEIVLMAGRLNALPFLKNVEEWARSIGCKKIKIEGRKGWVKILPDYSQKTVQLEKEL